MHELKANGRVILKNSIKPLFNTKCIGGLKVSSSGNFSLSCRLGRYMDGEPSHDVPFSFSGSICLGGVDSTPIRHWLPTFLPDANTALLPINVLLPTVVAFRCITPLRTSGEPTLTLSARKLPAPMESKSVDI